MWRFARCWNKCKMQEHKGQKGEHEVTQRKLVCVSLCAPDSYRDLRALCGAGFLAPEQLRNLRPL
jgi:hypothetical protein